MVRLDAARRQQDIIAAATDIVREAGFGAASVKAVTTRAGMSAGLLYSYAGSIDDVLADVFRACAGPELAAVDTAVRAAASEGAVAKLIALIETFTARALRGRRLAWALLVEPVGQSIDVERLAYRRGYAEVLAEIVQDGVRSGAFALQDPQLTAAGLVGAIGEALTGPLSPVAADAEPRQIIDAITQLCLRTVGASTSKEES